MTTIKVAHLSRFPYATGECVVCREVITKDNQNTYIVGTGIDKRGNSYVSEEDSRYPRLVCGIECAESIEPWE